MTILDRFLIFMERHRLGVLKVGAVAAGAAFLPMIGLHFLNLWRYKPHYQFFPFLLAAVAWMSWDRREELASIRLTRDKWRLPLTGIALTAAAVITAGWLESPWIGFAAFLLTTTLLSRNYPNLRSVNLLLWFLLPLPLGKDRELISELQRFSSRGASAVLDIVSVPHVMAGNVLETADRRFFVEEACSGINSVFIILATTACVCVLLRLRWIVVVPLLVVSVVSSMIANTLRICAIAYVWDRWQADWSSGNSHDLLGLVVYGVAITMAGVTGLFINELAAPIRPRRARDGSIEPDYGHLQKPTLVQRWNRLTAPSYPSLRRAAGDAQIGGMAVSPVIAACVAIPFFVLMTGMSHRTVLQSLAGFGGELKRDAELHQFGVDDFRALTEVDLTGIDEGVILEEAAFEDRSELSSRSLFGAYSCLWNVRHKSVAARYALDGPFYGWHDLRICYENQGWEIANTTTESSASEDGREYQFLIVDLIRIDDRRSALLIFVEFFADGLPVAPPVGWDSESVVRGLTNRFENLRDTTGQEQGEVLQLQVLIPCDSVPSDGLKQVWQKRLLNLLKSIVPRCRERISADRLASGSAVGAPDFTTEVGHGV